MLRLKGRGFTGKDGKRGDQLVTVEIDVPAGDPSCSSSPKAGTGAATRARRSAFSAAGHEGPLPPIARGPAQAAGEHAGGLRHGGRGEAQAACDGLEVVKRVADRRL